MAATMETSNYNNAMMVEHVNHMRYLALAQRRSAPPRCNPITILVLTLSLGMMFIGLTMLVIAHWPGATTIGENPLKIAGPVLFSVGATVFLVGIFLACWLNTRERKKFFQNVTNIAKSQL